jgi:beta-glucosidase/6-phospho-beta-glucosidase/beta-galactosidase/ABC-type amino acid transport substrate-binding protein
MHRESPGRLLFGVGNSDHQSEAFDPKYPDIRDTWEAATGKVTRGRATDFWNRFAEDIHNAKSLGCDIFRFSVAWARVEPSPGRFNSKAIAHYRKLVQTVHGAGMQALVTLHHFAWPAWVEAGGGMAAPGFPKLFARYASVVARRIGPDVRFWDTINEPTVLIFGYLKPWWQKEYFFPPGSMRDIPMGKQVEQLGKLIRNLFLAHTAGRAAIHKVNPDALVGTNPAMLGLPGWAASLLDWLMTRVSSPKKLHHNLGRMAERGFSVRKNADLVLGALTRTPARQEKIDFSDGYLETGYSLLTAAASKEAAVIAVVKSTTGEAAARRAHPAAKIARYSTAKAALAALDRKAVDSVMTDSLLADAMVKQFPDRYRIAQRLEAADVYAVGVRKGSTQWLQAVNGALRDFTASGGLEKSVRRHFGAAGRGYLPRGAARPTRTAQRTRRAPDDALRLRSEIRAIRRRGYLVAAVRDDVPGLCFRDNATGEWSGVEVDLARAVARHVFGDPSRVRFRAVRTAKRVPLLRSVFNIFDGLIRTITILTSVADSSWWHLGMAGRLDPFLCPPACVGQMDYAGLDYYWGVSSLRLRRLGALFDALMRGQYLQAPVWPGGLGAKLAYVSRLFPRKPIVILENGSVVAADGTSRETYLRRHVAEVHRGRRAGINVMGYLCWSITSNRELGAAFDDQSDFGLFHVDLDKDPKLTRKITPSAHVFRELIAEEREREKLR